MNYFPNGSEEIELLKFLAKYQYLSVKDEKYFFNTSRYYRARIKRLIEKNYLKKNKLVISLDKLGIECVKMLNFEYKSINRNRKHIDRLARVSSIGAFYHDCKQVKFTPSFDLKDKKTYTVSSRRFIGLLDISDMEYLTYQMPTIKDVEYVKSVIYDLQKEKKYTNVIVFTNEIKGLPLSEFAFGVNQVLLIEETEANKEKLKYMHNVRWADIIQKYYKQDVVISEYGFCDYTDHKEKYISTFYFLDTEKINRIKMFLIENKNKNADIICDSKIAEELKKEIPGANYCIVNFEDYIDKERIIYD